jgi:tetratricopeptide (TPR) repeat protein
LEQHKFNLVIENIQEALRAIPPSKENDKSILKQKSNLLYQLGISCDLLGDFDLAYESYTKAIKIQNLFRENENMLRLSISSHQRSTAAEKSFHSEGGLEE